MRLCIFTSLLLIHFSVVVKCDIQFLEILQNIFSDFGDEKGYEKSWKLESENIESENNNLLKNYKDFPLQQKIINRGGNGGIPCAACTILMSVGLQLGQIYNETVVQSLERLCGYLPNNYKTNCEVFVDLIGPFLLDKIEIHSSADTLCYSLKICYIDPGKEMCHLLPLPVHPKIDFHHPNSIRSSDVNLEYQNLQIVKQASESITSIFPLICFLPGFRQICEALNSTYDGLVPGVDIDGDRYSSVEILRGSLWRGRDCSDLNSEFYPGRKALDLDKFQDSNCNGIYGVNPDTNVPYEEELCSGSGQRGVIYIGDSVGAHFHAPPIWFKPAMWESRIFDNLSYVVSNEGNWPDVGFATGFRDATYMPDLIFDEQVDSIYLKLRRRNLCNHRDYQNLARNGANSNDTITYVKSLSRNEMKDNPAIVFYALVGNDVCSETTNENEEITSPQKFYNNTMEVLSYLEEVLPPESHVILVGLINGDVIYQSMAKRIHPLGDLKGDITYDDVYNWFNCMEIGPCSGWMNSNATIRRSTTRKANRLTKVLKTIAAEETFDKFDIHFVKNPFRTVINEWIDGGGSLWQLIEPVDSLHPTQQAQHLIADALWKELEHRLPFVLGPENPKNEQIRKLFGDQGGH